MPLLMSDNYITKMGEIIRKLGEWICSDESGSSLLKNADTVWVLQRIDYYLIRHFVTNSYLGGNL